MRVPLVLLSLGCRESLSSRGMAYDEAPRAWAELLARVVTLEGAVDYDLLEREREPLDDYVAWITTDAAWTGRANKDWHAQYLNIYNALVLFQVVERERPESVRDVGGLVPVPGYTFFHGTQFRVDMEWLSLAEIENERIRWKEMDYRDHAALVCGARSCPPLRAELYRTPSLQGQLDDQMNRWVMDDERGVRVEDGVAVFNPIFDWYARDFEFFSAGRDPCTLAAEHATGKKRIGLLELAAEGCPRTFFDYDWSLNEARR